MPPGNCRRGHIHAGLRTGQTLRQQRVNGGFQGIHVDGLGKKNIPQRGFFFWRDATGRRDHGNLGKCGIKLQPFAQGNSVHTWHVPVRHYQIGKVPRCLVEGCLPAFREEYAVTASLQDNLKQSERIHFIVDEQDSRHVSSPEAT